MEKAASLQRANQQHRLAACRQLPGLPQAAGEHPGGGLLGPCQEKV